MGTCPRTNGREGNVEFVPMIGGARVPCAGSCPGSLRLMQQPDKPGTLNFSQCVEGRRWWPGAREGLAEARVCAGDAPCNGEERRRTSTRCDARQSVRN